MTNNTTDRGPTDREIFILADAAHRKRDFDSAKLYYRTIIEFERDLRLVKKSRRRLVQVEKGKRPSGNIGFIALGLVLIFSGIAASPFMVPGPLGYVLIPILFAIPVCAIWALFQPGLWNKAAAGVTALIAISFMNQPHGYTNRARVTEGLSSASAGKTAVSEFYAEHQRFPAANEEAGLSAPETISSHSVYSVTLSSGGLITVVYKGGPLEGKTMELKATLDQRGRVRWDCTGGTLGAKYRPSSCRQ